MTVYCFFYDTADSCRFMLEQPAELDGPASQAAGYDVYILPENATFIAPPIPDHPWKVPFFVLTEPQEWYLAYDYRGANIVDANGDPYTMTVIGPLPEGCTLVPASPTPEQAAIDRGLFKARRSYLVQGLTVVVDGMRFNACENSQCRMIREIMSVEWSQGTVIAHWTLADNTVATNIPLATFKEALAASVQATDALWVNGN